MVYPPSEDSYILENEIKKFLNKLSKEQKENFKVLDMGSGSGIQAIACMSSGIKRKNIIAADIDPKAIKMLKEKRIPARKTDLFSNIRKDKKFDLIVFNAPYLPEDKYDKMPDTTAGKKGNEVIIRFLRKAKRFLASDGVVLLLFSSLSRPEKILAYAKKRGYNSRLLEEKSAGMMEKLFVYMFY